MECTPSKMPSPGAAPLLPNPLRRQVPAMREPVCGGGAEEE
jgi:hypothetical protein